MAGCIERLLPSENWFQSGPRPGLPLRDSGARRNRPARGGLHATTPGENPPGNCESICGRTTCTHAHRDAPEGIAETQDLLKPTYDTTLRTRVRRRSIAFAALIVRAGSRARQAARGCPEQEKRTAGAQTVGSGGSPWGSVARAAVSAGAEPKPRLTRRPARRSTVSEGRARAWAAASARSASCSAGA